MLPGTSISLKRWTRGIFLLGTTALLAVATAGVAAEPAAEPAEVAAPTKLINRLLASAWQEHNLKPSERTTDAQFLRRAFRDIVGRVPTEVETAAFEKDAEASRRSVLVTRLLAEDGYAANWAALWTRWLLPEAVHPSTRVQLRRWLEGQLARNVSHKDLVQRLLTATGKNTDNGAVNFLLAHLGSEKAVPAEEGQFDLVPATVTVPRVFLGIRFECFQCHDHPYSAAWRQRNFWAINAFFRQVERKGTPCTSPTVATTVELGDNLTFNKWGRVLYTTRKGIVLPTAPTLPGGKPLDAHEMRPRREILADWVVGHDNFGPAFVNRLWGHFFGRGLHQSPDVDDFGEYNPVLHPDLLVGLAKAFTEAGHDPKKLIVWICASDAYQLQTAPNATNQKTETDPFFSRMLKE
jgi:hypothetical protein